MKDTYAFFMSSGWYVKYRIIASFIRLPAIMLHELCHLLTAVALLIKVQGVVCDYFYKVEGNSLSSYKFYVATGAPDTLSGYTRQLLVAISPLLLILSLPFVLFYYPLVGAYLVYCLPVLFPSEQDYKNARFNINRIKAYQK